ncbi:hypothetical protein SLA2020_312540 [Shorea laevis]
MGEKRGSMTRECGFSASSEITREDTGATIPVQNSAVKHVGKGTRMGDVPEGYCSPFLSRSIQNEAKAQHNPPCIFGSRYRLDSGFGLD